MKTIIGYYKAEDQYGNGTAGLTLHCYPYDTVTNDADISDLGSGIYKITIDPSGNNSRISRYYDIYEASTLKLEKQFIAEWVFYTTVETTLGESPEDFNFTDLTDENAESLPATIPNAKCEICYTEEDRPVSLSATSDTGFTLVAGSSGDSDDVTTHLKITIGEA